MSGSAVRLGIFLSLWALLLLAEHYFPRHLRAPQRRDRWPVNIGLALVDTLCLRLLLPWLAVDAALWAQAQRFGLLHLIALPAWASAVIAFISLDLLIYWQHRLSHALPWLWRLHRVHHTDRSLDVSSGTRFHPLEILLSMLLKIAAVLALGAAPVAVLLFEIVLSSFALLTHSNIAIPGRFERALRRVFVTPDMHRIHHSVDPLEHNRNFSFHVSWWDRLFGSYRDTPAEPQSRMTLGLDAGPAIGRQGFVALLTMPFR